MKWINRDSQTVFRMVGLLLHVPGVMAVLSLPVCFAFHEEYAILPFGLTAIASFGLGQLLCRWFPRADEVNLQHAMLIVALSWAIIPLPGVIPFVAIANHLTTLPNTTQTIYEFQFPLNALFEAVSGFTSTGLTMALDASQLPHTLQWWRSLMEWVGGVGIIVLMLCVLEPIPDPGQLYEAAGWQKKIAPSITRTVRKIWGIYLLHTGLSILLLKVVGMPWWDALNHGMTGISTGGFSITGKSLSRYSAPIQSAAIAIMISGAISFAIHAQLLSQRRLSSLWSNAQHRLLWLLLGLGTIALLAVQYVVTGRLPLLDSLFQWTSALTTCGFNTVKIQTWSPSARLLLSLAMIIGAASGSTCGGLKLSRIVTLGRAIAWHIQSILPKSDQQAQRQVDGSDRSKDDADQPIKSATVLIVLWLGLILTSVLVLLQVVPSDYAVVDVFFEAASAIGTSGLSVGITHPDLPAVGKLVLILLMWLGRVKIIAVMVLLTCIIRRFNSFAEKLERD